MTAKRVCGGWRRLMNKGKNKNRTSTREILRMVAGIRKSFLPLMILEQMLSCAILFLNIIVGAMILDGVAEALITDSAMESTEQRLVGQAVGLVLLNMVLALCRWGLNKWLIILRRGIDDGIRKQISEKCLTLDYQILERKDTLDYIEKASEGSQTNGGITGYCSAISGIFGNIVSIIYSVILMSRFFMSRGGGKEDGLADFASSFLAGLLMLLLIGTAVLFRFLISRRAQRMQYQAYEDNLQVNRRYGAYFMFLSEYKPGKQVRIYDMVQLILHGFGEMSGRLRKKQEEVVRKEAWLSTVTEVVMGSLLLICYGFVGIKAVSGAISIGEVSLYVGCSPVFQITCQNFLAHLTGCR